MAITNEERNWLKQKMMELLNEYDYEWTDDALDTIIDTWEENKGDLIEAFKTHPNYIEGKFMIAFDTDYDRDIDMQAVHNFADWLIRYRNEIKLPNEIKEKVSDTFDYYLPADVYFLLQRLARHANRTISESSANEFNSVVPETHAHPGQKTTRVINKLCKYLGYDKVDGYNREYAKFADALTPLKITRHTILSLNPLDYLTMSFGNSWSSCHTIDKTNKRNMPNGYQGAYSSGTMSYMLDQASFVFYTVDSNYNGTDYFTQPKVTRQMFHYGNEKLVQGRLYPANGYGADDIYTQYRNVVQEIIAQVFDIPNFWTLKRDYYSSEYIYSRGTHYQDYCHFDECTLSLLKGSENEDKVEIGHKPICINCGDTHYEEDTITCCRQGDFRCTACGEWIDEDDVRWVDGDPYCCDCANWCACCEEYHRTEVYHVRNYGYVCQDCMDEYFTYCEICGDNVPRDESYYIESEDRYVCDRCYHEYYSVCADCGAVCSRDDMFEHDGELYCEVCYDVIEVEENENEEEAV